MAMHNLGGKPFESAGLAVGAATEKLNDAKRNIGAANGEHPWRDIAAALEDLARGGVALEAAVRETVELARSLGMPWERIGDALGLSKQGAQQRYRSS